MRFGKLFILGGLLAAEPVIPLAARVAAKEIVDYRKIEELDSLKIVIIKNMGEEDYRRLNAMKAIVEMDGSSERVVGPFGEEKAVRFEKIAGYFQEAGIFEIMFDTSGYWIKWSEGARGFLTGKEYDPKNIGDEIIKRWRGGQLIGQPYYGILMGIARQFARTDYPETDARIIAERLGENYVTMAEAIGSISRWLYLGDKDSITKYIGIYNSANYNSANPGKYPYIVFKFGSAGGDVCFVKKQPEDIAMAPKPPNKEKGSEKSGGGGIENGKDKGNEGQSKETEQTQQPTQKDPITIVSEAWGMAEYAYGAKNYQKAKEEYEYAKKVYEGILAGYGKKSDSDPLVMYFEGCILLCKANMLHVTDSTSYAEKKYLYEEAKLYFERVRGDEKYSESATKMYKECEKGLEGLEKTVWGKREKADSLYVEAVLGSEEPETALEKLKEAMDLYESARQEYKKMKNKEKEEEMQKLVNTTLEEIERTLLELIFLANNAQRNGEYEKTIEYYKKVIDVYSELAKKTSINEKKQDYIEKVKIYKKYLEEAKANKEKFDGANEKMEYGNSLINEGKYFEAIEVLEEAKKMFEELGVGAKNKAEECDDLILLARKKNIEGMYKRMVGGTEMTLEQYLAKEGINRKEWKNIVERIGKEGIEENGAINEEYLKGILGEYYKEKGMGPDKKE
jgi:tetratricopeptide (TPR) repeat protein